MKITTEQYLALKADFRKIGLFYCESCETYFELSASRSGLLCCPRCGENDKHVLSVKVFEHDDNDLDDDFD